MRRQRKLAFAAAILALLLAVDDVSATASSAAEQGVLVNGCGPVAVFVACRWVGVDCNLRRAVEACNWQEGESTKVKAVVEALSELGVSHWVGRLNAAQLEELLEASQAVALLGVGNDAEQTRHIVTAVEGRDGRFVIIDHPRWATEWDSDRLREQWNGYVIVTAPPGVEISQLRGLEQVSNGVPVVALLFCGVVVLMGLGLLARGTVAWMRKRRDAG